MGEYRFIAYYLGQAQRVTEEIIDAIEKLTPGAFGTPFFMNGVPIAT